MSHITILLYGTGIDVKYQRIQVILTCCQHTLYEKILVVDDDEDILTMLKNFLQAKGYDVKVTLTCEEGLIVFYAYQPDLVMLDVNVGSDDGRLMCRKIKSQANYQHIPVILISANSEGLKSYVDYGAVAAVEKPFQFVYLLGLIESHM